MVQYAVWNTADVTHVGNFTGLINVCHEIAASLLASSSCIKSDLMQLNICAICRLLQTICNKDNQLASSCWQLASDLLPSSRSKRRERVQILVCARRSRFSGFASVVCPCFNTLKHRMLLTSHRKPAVFRQASKSNFASTIY